MSSEPINVGTPTIPAQYRHQDIESKWGAAWEDTQIYKWKIAPRSDTFSIDTPPPTVSGSLHVGHVFSYTQTDIMARFKRMCGKTIFYPMGWDDNGLPTERRVQNVFGIACNPALPFEPEWVPTKIEGKRERYIEVSRQNFIQACEQLTKEDEQAFESMWRKLGLSIDWSMQYATINEHCRRISQYSFLELVKKGQVYQQEAPTMWDVDFQTAVAQAEIEDRTSPGAYHHIRFQVQNGGEFVIATTRPELLAACIAVVAHPDDERFKPLFGKTAITPLFHMPVPILPADHADPEKGTGILMVCTFGDTMDVEWWKTTEFPIKPLILPNGRLADITFGEGVWESLNPEAANEAYASLKGLRVKQARRAIVELLSLAKPPEPIEHPVKFYEKGDSPIEFITTRQWFINILDHKDKLKEQGDKIQWHPEHMKTRYTNWVEGLNQDWCISRQRFFGVPFPVWYPMSSSGQIDYERPIMATPDQLPIDPALTAPPGYTPEQRNQPDGFVSDPDVMDTWATSSLTPQLMSGWPDNDDRHKSVFPLDIRPQSHEIIRTWAFYTIVKSWMHHGQIPWKNVLISGWVLDPDRKKMSKSKGNVVTPDHMLDTYSADAVRYWSGRAKLGSDTAFDESVFLIGKKLVTKLVNASKFVLAQLAEAPADTVWDLTDVTECIDKAWIAHMGTVVAQATQSFELYDYAAALDKTESAFWMFCDHYIELVKGRAYQESGAKQLSVWQTLNWTLKTFLRLLAPYLPYVTEEIWSWRYTAISPSVHISLWPDETEYESVVFPSWKSQEILDPVIQILSEIRAAKTQAQKSMKHPVTSLTISGPESFIALIDMYPDILEDLKRAGSVTSVKTALSQTVQIQVAVVLEKDLN
jgi:valyl-tRNA synthetase